MQADAENDTALLERLIKATAAYLRVSDAGFYSKRFMFYWPKNTKPAAGEFRKIDNTENASLRYEWINPINAEHEASIALAAHLHDQFSLTTEPQETKRGSSVKITFGQSLDEMAFMISKLEEKTRELKQASVKDKEMVDAAKSEKPAPKKHRRKKSSHPRAASSHQDDGPPPNDDAPFPEPPAFIVRRPVHSGYAESEKQRDTRGKEAAANDWDR